MANNYIRLTMFRLVNSVLNFWVFFSIEEKIEDDSPDSDGYPKSSVENANKLDTDNEIREMKPSKFTYLKRGILMVFSQIICFFRIWNVFSYRILTRFYKRKIFDA